MAKPWRFASVLMKSWLLEYGRPHALCRFSLRFGLPLQGETPWMIRTEGVAQGVALGYDSSAFQAGAASSRLPAIARPALPALSGVEGSGVEGSEVEGERGGPARHSSESDGGSPRG